MIELNKVYNMDCLDGLKDIPDKYFDLLLTDPPYGIFKGETQIGGEGICKNRIFPPILWDDKPSKEMMIELFRVSKNQIIFGFEHLSDILPQSRGVYCWDKERPEGTTFSEFELIWTSFDRRAQFIRFMWNGCLKDNNEIIPLNRIHPTEKPIDILKTLLLKHSKEGDKVLDAFAGSGSTLIACMHLKRDYMGFEKDKYYYDKICERIKEHSKQQRLA